MEVQDGTRLSTSFEEGPPMPGMNGRESETSDSEKVTALKPRSALRRTSAAAMRGSRSHVICCGTSRSGWTPTHSSATQSLYTWNTKDASSGSTMLLTRCPAKPNKTEGKHSDAAIPARSMSSTRASTSYAPGRHSLSRIGERSHSDTGRPTIDVVTSNRVPRRHRSSTPAHRHRGQRFVARRPRSDEQLDQ